MTETPRPQGSPSVDDAAADLEAFFDDADHWVYRSRGTLSGISPDSVYHIRQLQVLFENCYLHKLSYDAIRKLMGTVLSWEEFETETGRIILVWKKSRRYVRRDMTAHLRLAEEYSLASISKATGQHAEMLTLLGLSRLHLTLVAKNSRTYEANTWTDTGHDLDFIMEKNDRAYGVEVKNTFDYMPRDEFLAKLEMCSFLGLKPLFVVRVRHPDQWELARVAGGLVYMFGTKIFPPGQESFVKRIWWQMRLPVGVWTDWDHTPFYKILRDFLER